MQCWLSVGQLTKSHMKKCFLLHEKTSVNVHDFGIGHWPADPAIQAIQVPITRYGTSVIYLAIHVPITGCSTAVKCQQFKHV